MHLPKPSQRHPWPSHACWQLPSLSMGTGSTVPDEVDVDLTSFLFAAVMTAIMHVASVSDCIRLISATIESSGHNFVTTLLFRKRSSSSGIHAFRAETSTCLKFSFLTYEFGITPSTGLLDDFSIAPPASLKSSELCIQLGTAFV